MSTASSVAGLTSSTLSTRKTSSPNLSVSNTIPPTNSYPEADQRPPSSIPMSNNASIQESQASTNSDLAPPVIPPAVHREAVMSGSSPNSTDGKPSAASAGSQTSSQACSLSSNKKRTFDPSEKDVNASDSEFVSISIGSNVLQISLNDTIEFFSNASNSLLVEGDYWQQQGPLSYVGLTKSDPFIKIIRSFSIEIFKTEEFAKFVHRKKNQRVLSKSRALQVLPRVLPALERKV